VSNSPSVDLAGAVLDAVVAHWPVDNDGLPYLTPLPERQYVWIGAAPARDCAQLTVGVERAFGTQGGDPSREAIVSVSSGQPWLRTMVCSIELLRCITVIDQEQLKPELPEASRIIEESNVALTDADMVLECVIAAQRAGELAGCGGIAFEGWRAVNADGGLSGSSTRVRLNLF
jgi:hypothetical protein